MCVCLHEHMDAGMDVCLKTNMLIDLNKAQCFIIVTFLHSQEFPSTISSYSVFLNLTEQGLISLNNQMCNETVFLSENFVFVELSQMF